MHDADRTPLKKLEGMARDPTGAGRIGLPINSTSYARARRKRRQTRCCAEDELLSAGSSQPRIGDGNTVTSLDVRPVKNRDRAIHALLRAVED